MTDAPASDRCIERAYRVRLRVKPAVAWRLQRLFGARRFVWNWALRRQDEAYRLDGTRLNAKALSREFTALRKAPDTAWLAELPRMPFSQTLRDLDRAVGNLVAGRAKRPRRKRFGTVNSARFTLDQRRDLVDRDAGSVQIDGIGRVRFRVTEPLQGRLRSITVSCDAAGRWFGTLTADKVPAPTVAPPVREAIGVDLGLKATATLSDGTVIPAPKHLAPKLQRLKRYQRSYGRGQDAQLVKLGLDPKKPIPKGTRVPASKRMARRKRQIGRLHTQVADARRDHQHQTSAKLVATAQIIGIENLAVKAMGRSLHRGFRRSVADAGLGELLRQVMYKAHWSGRTVSVIDRWYPSSKTCSACGTIKADLTLRDRRWTCTACGSEHDRDQNAATNIERQALWCLAREPAHEGVPRGCGGTEARGADSCAVDRTPSITPMAMKRELSLCAATPRASTRRRDGPLRCVEAG